MKKILFIFLISSAFYFCSSYHNTLYVSPDIEYYAQKFYREYIKEHGDNGFKRYISVDIDYRNCDTTYYQFSFFEGIGYLRFVKPLFYIKKEKYSIVGFSNLGSEIGLPDKEIERIYSEISPNEYEVYMHTKKTGIEHRYFPKMIYEGPMLMVLYTRGKFERSYYVSAFGKEIKGIDDNNW